MAKAFLGQVLLFGFLLLYPLSAESIDKETRIPINGLEKIVVNGDSLEEVRLGVNIVTTTATVKSWEGDELAVIQKGRRSLGRITPLAVTHARRGSEAAVSLSPVDSFGIGIRIGAIEITILVPETWEGELELKDFSVPTSIEELRTGTLTVNMQKANLTVTDSEFRAVEMSMGADSNFEADNVSAGTWRLRGKLGKITARNITGSVDAETADGNILIDFSEYSGTSRLVSKLGKITVFVPADSQLDLSLSSALGSVGTDLPAIGPVTIYDSHRLEGQIGTSQNTLAAHSGDGKVRVLSK